MNKINSQNNQAELTLISSRPGMGKTSFAIQLATSVVDKRKTLYISNETIENKIIANLTGIELKLIKSSRLTPRQIVEIQNKKELLNKLNFSIIENFQFTMKNSVATIRENILTAGAELVFVDGINWKDFKESKEDILSYINFFKELKNLSNEFKIEIIVLHELDRTVEKKKTGSKPDLTDLINESFLIELATSIQFLYRPKYYGLQYDNSKFNEKHILEVFCAKDDKYEQSSMFFEINPEFNQFTPIQY